MANRSSSQHRLDNEPIEKQEAPTPHKGNGVTVRPLPARFAGSLRRGIETEPPRELIERQILRLMADVQAARRLLRRRCARLNDAIQALASIKQ